MELHINTIKNNNRQIELRLVSREKVLAKKAINAYMQQAEKLLPAISRMLAVKMSQSSRIKVRDKPARGCDRTVDIKNIKKIKVVNTGGSFTALRIGVVTANALGYALGVPVESTSGQPSKKIHKFQIVKPLYYKEPNITPSKKQ